MKTDIRAAGVLKTEKQIADSLFTLPISKAVSDAKLVGIGEDVIADAMRKSNAILAARGIEPV